jgi:hypothetical protein
MCGPHRKRPAAEEADDETSEDPKGFMLTNLPPISGKPSALLKERPDAVQAIVVFVGAARKAAETQFAAARARLAKLGKGKKSAADAQPNPQIATAPAAAAPAATVPVAVRSTTDALSRDPHTAPLPAAAQPSAMQTVASPPPGAFTMPTNQPERAARALPGATDVGNPSWMSFAPAAKADAAPAPLTAVPDSKSVMRLASVPLPRPRPRLAIAKRTVAAPRR